ncbi:MAG TPA: glycosyltransferase family A protein [Xanthobacteraceae bacterium]
MAFAFSCVWLILVVWLIRRALRQRHLLQPIAVAAPPQGERAATVAVIVPARDEEANIARCLTSLLEQSYPQQHLRVLMIDDHSSDDTAAITASLAKDHAQLVVLRSPPLPPGWIGKSHACWVGARAVPADAEWLCFMDADVWAEPMLLASALAAAEGEHLDLLSLAPRQQLESFAERLVMPCGLYLLAFRQDLQSLQSPHSKDATATGQFILVRSRPYKAVGGHAAVRTAICEDVELARLLKRCGWRVALGDGRELLSTRMYTGWSTLWVGVSKNLVDMLGGPPATVITAAVAVLLAWAAWLIPAFDAAGCMGGSKEACLALIPGLAGSAAIFGLHMAGASYFRAPLWYGLLFPLGYTAGAMMALDSVRRRLTHRISWKGRTYS